jgi:hypothetical protein
LGVTRFSAKFLPNVVMTPVPTGRVGPLHRSLLEALESIAARDQVRTLLRGALIQARLETIPEDADGFGRFVGGALTVAIERSFGAGAADTVREQLAHVLALVAPAVARKATGTGDDDADDLSGERIVDSFPVSPRTSDVISRPTKARPDIAAALHAPPSVRMPGPDAMPLEAPILFPPRATSFESGTQQKRALARVTRDPSESMRASRPGVEEVHGPKSGPRALATDVVVVSLDPRLAAEVEGRLHGRSRVVGVVTVAELMIALAGAKGGRVAVVLDTGVPSIDVPTFVSLEAALPASTHVILWGTDPRHKARLVAMFPQVRAWVASGSAESPVELLLTESER